GKERIGVDMRGAQCRDEEPPGIGSAEINASRRNRADDVSSEGNCIFLLTRGELLQGSTNLIYRRPLYRINGPFRRSARSVPHSLVHSRDGMEQAGPLAPFSRREKRVGQRRHWMLGRPGFGAHLRAFLGYELTQFGCGYRGLEGPFGGSHRICPQNKDT